MLSNLQILVVYIAALIAQLAWSTLQSIKLTAKSPSALMGFLALGWLISWFLGMLVWLVAAVVSGSTTFNALWVYFIVISLGVVALACALLVLVGEAIRTSRVVLRDYVRH